MKISRKMIAGLLCVLLVMAGCVSGIGNENQIFPSTGQEENPKQSKLNALQPSAYGNVQGLYVEPKKNISIIGRGEKSAYWTAVKEGAQDAVDEINEMLGYKGNDKLTLSYSAPETEHDVDGQVNILDEELARYPIALGIALVDSTASEVQFDMASDNGTPVVAFDSGTEHKNVVCMIDTDNIEAATTAAGKLCDSLNGSGEVLAFVHDSNSTSAKTREAGFVNGVTESYPDVKIAGVYHLDHLDDIKSEIVTKLEIQEDDEVKIEDITDQDVMQYIFEKHPNATGVYATSEAVAKKVIKAIDDLKTETEYKIISFDGGEDQLKRLEDGKLTGLIVQNPYGIGYATVVACIRASMGEGNEAIVDAGYCWVNEKNMESFAIQNMMY